MTGAAKGRATQERVYAAIVEFWRDNGYGPSLDEIAEKADLRSKSTVWYNLRSLKRDGRVLYVVGISRSIRVAS